MAMSHNPRLGTSGLGMPVRFPNPSAGLLLCVPDIAWCSSPVIGTSCDSFFWDFWIMHAPMPFNTRNWYPYYWTSTFCSKCLGLFLDSGQKSWFWLHVQPECNHTIIIAWGFRRYVCIYIYMYIYIYVNKTESTYIWLKYNRSPVACCDHTAIWGWFPKSIHHHSNHVTVRSFECFQICIPRDRYRSRYILLYSIIWHYILLYYITLHHIILYHILLYTLLCYIKSRYIVFYYIYM